MTPPPTITSLSDLIPTPVVEEEVEIPSVIEIPKMNENKEVPQNVMDGLKTFLDYVGADMNKVNEVLNLNQINKTDNSQEESVEVTPVTTTPIDIDNLPIIEQAPVGEETPLVEEPIVPGAPSLPIDDMVSKPEPVAQVVPTVPAEPTSSYVAQTNDVAPEIQPLEVPTLETPQQAAPIDLNPQPEIQAPVETVAAPQVEMNAAPEVAPLPEAAPQMQEPAQIDTSFLNAGPVVMPVGQEGVSSGLPGDNGAKLLEKVA